ncbi:polysaccharide deacetylase family protein [Sporosarcina sp. GW1-11]|uniref:polysaccharide deacetylase family protein n=1 Tax=Sporosarcina sp. GW1-11 TaxID=2899126 RepID=UPI00294F1EDD|nr:polysaccharide deacetylase family protein [Sporosarcina sp. GW1-11]MDV6379014.1 polysaccharide deacetylase family protein [Sporosarcina sp. GW1-11]
MKKMYSCGLLLVSAILFIISNGVNWNLNEVPLFQEQQGTVFAQTVQSERMVSDREFERVLTLQERQPIYMMAENLVQIGVVEADQPVAITGEDEAYYELRLGKMTAFIPKGRGMIEKQKVLPSVYAERFAAVETLETTIVYTDADLESDVLLRLEAGYRYPVVQELEDWYIMKIGERPGYIRKQSVVLDKGLPVLVYHQVLPRAMMQTTMSTISLESFEQQMGYLADQQFTTLTSQQLYNYLEGRLVVPSQAIVITFDDGLESAKDYAYPVLRKYGFTAPHHMISSRMDRGKGAPAFDGGGLLTYLTATDLEKLKDVFQFEAHTSELHELNHATNLGVVFDHTQEEILGDLRENLKNVPTAVSIAYPYGQYNEQFIAAAKEVGLLIGYTTVEGYATMATSNYEVNRFGVTEKRSFEQFATYVDGDMTWP